MNILSGRLVTVPSISAFKLVHPLNAFACTVLVLGIVSDVRLEQFANAYDLMDSASGTNTVERLTSSMKQLASTYLADYI